MAIVAKQLKIARVIGTAICDVLYMMKFNAVCTVASLALRAPFCNDFLFQFGKCHATRKTASQFFLLPFLVCVPFLSAINTDVFPPIGGIHTPLVSAHAGVTQIAFFHCVNPFRVKRKRLKRTAAKQKVQTGFASVSTVIHSWYIPC
jgi:hypothetical protein